MARTVLPADAVLMPLNEGALLVSRALATFCRIPRVSLEAVEMAMAGDGGTGHLEPALVQQLERHGFFGSPREPAAKRASLRLQLTNNCNLACDYCCTDSGIARENELGEAEWRRLVDEAFECQDGILPFGLLGGEPLLVPYAVDLARYILEKEGVLTFYTNGVLLADRAIAKGVAAIIQRGAEVRVSLAGPTAEVCDGLSGGERFDATMAGIENLAAHDVRVVVDLMVFPETAEAVAAHLDAFRKRLPQRTKMAFGIAYCGGRETGQHMFDSRRILEAAMDEIALNSGAAIPASPNSAVTNRREACHCTYGYDLHIRSDGQIFKCFKMEESIGHVSSEPLADVWQKARRSCRLATDLPACADCPLVTLCGGGCRSENILYTGDGDQPLCGPWRKRVLAEMLADGQVGVVEWPTLYLINEARARQLDVPFPATPQYPSLNSNQRT